VLTNREILFILSTVAGGAWIKVIFIDRDGIYAGAVGVTIVILIIALAIISVRSIRSGK
jgi:hypothetical protein